MMKKNDEMHVFIKAMLSRSRKLVILLILIIAGSVITSLIPPLVLEKAKFISYKRCMNDPVYSQQFKNCLENLILEISRKSPLDSKELKNNDTAVFADAVHYMTMNIDKNISISEIADECCISLTRLKYIFNKFCSTGIHKYFLNLKLSKACEMLSGGLSIGEIAEKLNFSSQNYFSIVFKREFGISPTEFKKEQQ